MLEFTLLYRKAIDSLTSNKALKFKKYNLDNDKWIIVEHLVSVLKVRFPFCFSLI